LAPYSYLQNKNKIFVDLLPAAMAVSIMPAVQRRVKTIIISVSGIFKYLSF
jgi:hypothetical protein